MREKVLNVIQRLFLEEQFLIFEGLSLNDKLQAMISESMLALMLVTSLEDEFDIEFDDDEVDLDFFSDIFIVIDRTVKHIKENEQ